MSRRKPRGADTPRTPASGPAVAEVTGSSLDPRLLVVAPLIFASGFCALVYQIGWQREFRMIFGGSTAASAAVVAVFMGGLGVGGWAIGRYTDRTTNALRLYALLEGLVALTAAATPTLLGLVQGVYVRLGGTAALGSVGGAALHLAMAGLVLLPPTFFAGGTLGAAARSVEGEGDRRRRGTALLYGVNTLGAVAGAVAATFWLLERLGTQATLWVAALANVSIAVAAATLSRERTGSSPTPGDETGLPEAPPAAPAALVLTASAVVGFAFFLMELVWYRMFGPILGGTVYTFGLVLAVALAGVALGGLLYAALFTTRPVTLTAFAVTCLLESATIALPYVLGDGLALLAASLRPTPGSALTSYLPGWTWVTAIVVLPPSIVAGAQFPLLVALLGQGRTRIARHIGNAYLWNTIGGILGALGGGFGLLPLLTAPGCWRGVSILLALLALTALVADRPPAGRLAFFVVGAGAVAFFVLRADGPTAAWRHSSIGVGRASIPFAAGPNAVEGWIRDMRRAIVWEREGIESSVAAEAIAALSFVVNGKVDGNSRNDAPTQVVSGILGALLHPNPRSSLVIGLGTGSTAGWLGAIPSMERTETVELEPAILEFARMCEPVNHGAMDNPRVRVSVGDAREVLMTGRTRYDLIFSEPSNPYRAGVASLFTREFYEATSSRLEPDGLFLQWMQAYDIDDWTASTIMATLGGVFPEVQVWQVHQTDFLLVGSKRPIRLDAATLRARMKEPPYAEALRFAWRAVELEDVLARFVAGPALVRDVRSRTTAVNTDDRNVVEFAVARTLSKSELFDILRLRRSAAALGAARPDVTGAIDWDRVARQRVAVYAIAGTPPPADPEGTEAEAIRAQAFRQYLAGDLAQAVDTFRRQPSPPEGPVETELFAEGLAEKGDREAIPHIRALQGIDATEAEAATARLMLRLGQPETARDALAAAFLHYRTDPWASQVSMSHALALADELTLKQPTTMPVVFAALAEPFSVSALEEPRRLVRLSVGSHGGAGDWCRDAVAPFEPHVPWRIDLLKYRAQCYERTADPRALEARADLEAFMATAAATPITGSPSPSPAPVTAPAAR